MPMFMKWGDTGTSESSTAHAREAVTLTLVDWTGLHADEPALPGKSAFDAYGAQADGASPAMHDGSVVFLQDPVVVPDHQPLPVLMVIADGHY